MDNLPKIKAAIFCINLSLGLLTGPVMFVALLYAIANDFNTAISPDIRVFAMTLVPLCALQTIVAGYFVLKICGHSRLEPGTRSHD